VRRMFGGWGSGLPQPAAQDRARRPSPDPQRPLRPDPRARTDARSTGERTSARAGSSPRSPCCKTSWTATTCRPTPSWLPELRHAVTTATQWRLASRYVELTRWAAAHSGDPMLEMMAAYVRAELFFTGANARTGPAGASTAGPRSAPAASAYSPRRAPLPLPHRGRTRLPLGRRPRPGHSPESRNLTRPTAAREIDEETGWRPGSLIPLLKIEPTAAISDYVNRIDLADGARRIGPPEGG